MVLKVENIKKLYKLLLFIGFEDVSPNIPLTGYTIDKDFKYNNYIFNHRVTQKRIFIYLKINYEYIINENFINNVDIKIDNIISLLKEEFKSEIRKKKISKLL